LDWGNLSLAGKYHRIGIGVVMTIIAIIGGLIIAAPMAIGIMAMRHFFRMNARTQDDRPAVGNRTATDSRQ